MKIDTTTYFTYLRRTTSRKNSRNNRQTTMMSAKTRDKMSKRGSKSTAVSSSEEICLPYINILPDSILRFIGEYLPIPSRAMMASAISRPACFDSDTLDFGVIERVFASKLNDCDIRGVLESIDAVNSLKVLKLTGCKNISGVGLEPLRSSAVLEQIDLSTSVSDEIATSADIFSPNFPWRFALLEDEVVPILECIIGKHGRSLRHVQLPLVWRKNESKLLTAFIKRYNRVKNRTTCSCGECGKKICLPYINILPDSILRFIGEYLPIPSRAMMASAFSRSACFDSDTLDFGVIERVFLSKLNDCDIRGVLESIDAVNSLKVLKLTGCKNISGVGLEPLRSSAVLEQIDLSTSVSDEIATSADIFSPNFPWRFALLEDEVVPILECIIGKHGRSLRHVQLPLVWRKNESKLLTAFIERYNRVKNRTTCSCGECGKNLKGFGLTFMNRTNGNSKWGLQNYTCYDCVKYFCGDCESPFCDTCQKKFCEDCCPTQYCDLCGRTSCMDCFEITFCEGCNNSYCEVCTSVCMCDCCDRMRCMHCVSHLFCAHCSKSNCGECAHENNVQECDVCEEELCNDCRLKSYKNGSLDCIGCRGLLLSRIMQEKDALQLENEILRANNFEKIMFVSEDIVINTLMHFADRAMSEEPSRVVEV